MKKPAAGTRKRPSTTTKRAIRPGKVSATNSPFGKAIQQMPAPEQIHVDSPPPWVAPGMAVRSGAAPKANTVVYIHGIGNKPVASILKCQWDNALFGTELGDRSRMAYWVNRSYYPEPEKSACGDSDLVEVDTEAITTSGIMALADEIGTDDAEDEALEREAGALAETPDQKAFLLRIAGRMATVETEVPSGTSAADIGAKIIPLPGFLRKRLARHLTRVFLRDVNDFLFHADRRKLMTDSLLERLSVGGGPFVVIAHSQGTMVAYEVLRQLDSAKFEVPLFVTIGSPLGMQEVQDVFKTWIGKKKLEPPACVARWVNVADRFDPVAIDSDISNDFGGTPKIDNRRKFGLNPDSPRHPHSGTGYLSTDHVRIPVRETLGNAFSQSIAQFVISRDLSEELEDLQAEKPVNTLIQLKTQNEDGKGQPLDKLGEELILEIRDLIAKRPSPDEEDADLEPPERLKRFVAAKLTRSEAELLRTRHRELKISRIWKDARKTALIDKSTHTVQANPANLGYGARGKDIGWAVLDTGIRGNHPHFERFGNIAEQWDCTRPGTPQELRRGLKAWDELDGHGHGTHVAGIIAGALDVKKNPRPQGGAWDEVPSVRLAGMAPETRVYGFKVLDDDGNGRDSWIIKALDLIADLNESSSSPVIHGVNLSLGGNFDPRVYGVGHTPLCQELRRLWRQGVIVCLAAGNEGWSMVQEQGGFAPTNRDISIGDPANLEEAIAIGSVHKENPHTYGISYFSSRGPTADGRQKPDVVAPGERVLSAMHSWEQPGDFPVLQDLYVEMSGTSMATPHVSGILAAFLSLRREFVGYPDQVKEMLLRGCTDLGRDRYMQGAGLPNLIRMLSDN